MTNEEAIKLLSQIRDVLLASNSWLPSTHNPIKESFGMAINALKAQEVSNDSPELDKENGELIRRKAAIEALKEAFNPSITNFVKAKLAIENLPSAQPEMIREIRKWINSGNRGNADYFIVDKIEEIINKYE